MDAKQLKFDESDLKRMMEELSFIHTQLGKPGLMALMQYVATVVGIGVLHEGSGGVRMNLSRLRVEHLVMVYNKAVSLKSS